jgi:hypothetical protein
VGQRALKCVDDLQMKSEHGAVMGGDTAAQCFAQFAGLSAGVTLSQRGQPHRVVRTRDDGFEHRPPAATKHVGEYAAEFDAGVLEHLLNTQTMLGDLAGQLFVRPCQIAQLLNRSLSESTRARADRRSTPHR